MKTSKKYYSESQIIKEIDAAKVQKEREAITAEALDKEANEKFYWINQNPKQRDRQTEEYKEVFHRATYCRAEAARLRKHQSAFQVKLERLKRTLAAFNTMPMSFCEQAVISQ